MTRKNPSPSRWLRGRFRASRPGDPTGNGMTALIVAGRGESGAVFHLAATRRIRVGYTAVLPGECLCGTPGRLRPHGHLFPPAVTCWMCAVIAKRDGILTEGTGAA